MSRLLDPNELRGDVRRIVKELRALLERAELEREKVDAALAEGNSPAQQFATQRLAHIARQLTRAQAVLVHPDDSRYAAAQAVLGYCDEADGKARPWSEPAAPVRLGAVAS